jgi:molybdate transport system permease protein
MSGGMRPAGVLARIAMSLAIGLLVSLLALPVIALLLRVTPSDLWRRLREPAVLDALRLSLVTSGCATLAVIALGLPTAWLLATRTFPGKRALEVLVDLPMVLPPTVAGFALLMAFGRAGLVGPVFSRFGVTIPFSTLGVILAQTFMAAPFFIAPARAGILAVPGRLIEAAATLRSSEARTFFRVVLPLSLPSLVAGAAMSCARALGEFGATITFAGNLPGTTRTMPLAVYVAMQSDLDAAIALSVLLLVLSGALLFGLRLAPAGLFAGGFRAARDGRQDAR